MGASPFHNPVPDKSDREAPFVNVPDAVNACICPTLIVAALGSTATDVNAAKLAVTTLLVVRVNTHGVVVPHALASAVPAEKPMKKVPGARAASVTSEPAP
jgi:hypothetical protein